MQIAAHALKAPEPETPQSGETLSLKNLTKIKITCHTHSP
jgi:hypothetical protein